MKFFDLDNNEIGKNIQKYKLDRRKKSASKGQKLLGEKLIELFPNITIYTEVPCFGTKMRLDFFIPDLNLCCEFNGKQHEEFNPFFHGSKRRFLESQQRDNEKAEWCKINGLRLLVITEKTMDNLKSLIYNIE